MKNKKNIRKKHFKDKLYILTCTVIILLVTFYCFRFKIYNSLLDSNSMQLEAKIINEKNILGKGIITQMYTYSYEFYVNGDSYTGDSRNQKYKIGDVINIEYWPYYPGINRPRGNVSD